MPHPFKVWKNTSKQHGGVGLQQQQVTDRDSHVAGMYQRGTVLTGRSIMCSPLRNLENSSYRITTPGEYKY